MRRGLLSWDKEEVPAAKLEARVARCQRAISDTGLGCLLVYTNFPRPAAVSWLTNFVPYWSQAVLLVFPDGMPVLVASLTPRVGLWIASVSHLGDITHTPDTGGAAAKLIAERCPDGRRVGVVELDGLPGGIALPLAAGLGRTTLEDSTTLFADLRDPADDVEIALCARASEIASAALDAGIAASDGGSGAINSAIESTARHAGAEDVLIHLAPNLGNSSRLERIEGGAAMGERFAVQVSVAYKGHWVRELRSICASGIEPEDWREAEARFDAVMADLHDGTAPDDAQSWLIEGNIGTRPLSVLASNENIGDRALRKGTIRVVSLQYDLADGPWVAGRAVTIRPAPRMPARPERIQPGQRSDRRKTPVDASAQIQRRRRGCRIRRPRSGRPSPRRAPCPDRSARRLAAAPHSRSDRPARRPATPARR